MKFISASQYAKEQGIKLAAATKRIRKHILTGQPLQGISKVERLGREYILYPIEK